MIDVSIKRLAYFPCNRTGDESGNCNVTTHVLDTSRAGNTRDSRGRVDHVVGWLLLQKVFTDGPGDFSWCPFVDPEVVKSWKFLRFRLREYRCKPLHCHIHPFGIAFAAIHEKDACSYFSVVCITTVKLSHFLVFAQIFREETQHLLALVGT